MHKSQVQPVPLVPLPRGIPTYTSSHMTGRFVAAPGYLPVTIFFEDWDLYWVRAGRGAFLLGTGHRIDVKPDDLLLLPPLVSAQVIETRPALEFDFCHFGFRPSARPLSAWDGADCQGPGPDARVPLRFRARQAPAVVRAYRALNRASGQVRARQTPGRPWKVESAVLNLIAELAAFGCKKHPGQPIQVGTGLPGISDGRVLRLLARIDADPARPWRVTELAREAGLSAGHLHALTTRVTGRSLKDHIIDARLRLAIRLLRPSPSGNRPLIKEASRRAGFSSQHYFSRLFTARYGVGPAAFQNSQQPL